MNILDLLPYLQLAVAMGTFAGMLYALKKFTSAPHDTLEKRVSALEVRVDKQETSLNESHNRHRDEKKIDSLIITSLIALIEFEADYCVHHGGEEISDGLNEARKKLYAFLAEK